MKFFDVKMNLMSTKKEILTYFSVNGMEILIYDAKVRQDPQSKQFLGNATAPCYFYHGTAVKVSKINFKYIIFNTY